VDLLTLLLRLPFLPVRGFVRLAEVIRDEADRQLYDPAVVRRQLEAAEEAHAAGRIPDEELADIERAAVGRLTGQAPGQSPPGASPGDGR
jgi:hypothetical protein